jgi:SAM-dependent methyltransferase
MSSLYDSIGAGYRLRRRPEPRISRQILRALGPGRSLANIGAGSGSYEPPDRFVVPIEPSATMIRQRARSAALAVQALAANLPLRDACVDASMAVLTVHHWQQRARGLDELARVARHRAVILTWDPASAGFWLTQDYFPEILEIDRRIFPPISDLLRAFGRASVHAVPIPHDCVDGFLGAYWRRPKAYLDSAVRSGMSTFSKVNVAGPLARLRADLASGSWMRRYGRSLRGRDADLGYRLIVADVG